MRPRDLVLNQAKELDAIALAVTQIGLFATVAMVYTVCLALGLQQVVLETERLTPPKPWTRLYRKDSHETWLSRNRKNHQRSG